jgi:hypothetical protein
MLHLIYLVSYYLTVVGFSNRNTLISLTTKLHTDYYNHLTYSEEIRIRVQ